MSNIELKHNFRVIQGDGLAPANDTKPFEDMIAEFRERINRAEQRQECYLILMLNNKGELCSGSRTCLRDIWDSVDKIKLSHQFRLLIACDLSIPTQPLIEGFRTWYQFLDNPINNLPEKPPQLLLEQEIRLALPSPKRSAEIIPFSIRCV